MIITLTGFSTARSGNFISRYVSDDTTGYVNKMDISRSTDYDKVKDISSVEIVGLTLQKQI